MVRAQNLNFFTKFIGLYICLDRAATRVRREEENDFSQKYGVSKIRQLGAAERIVNY